MTKNAIEIAPLKKKELATEFETSLQTVQMSLKYVFNSKQARNIRLRAKEMLQKEIDEINANLNID